MASTTTVYLLFMASAFFGVNSQLDHGVCLATLKEHSYPKTCKDVKSTSNSIYELVIMDDGMELMCDTHTEGGGWTVIQKRIKGDLDFYRGWDEYKYGFAGQSGDFWLGLEKIFKLTRKRSYELYIRFDHNYKNYFARYKHFRVMSEKEYYKLQLSGYSGNSGDSLAVHNMAKFSTKDKDNDGRKEEHCAQRFTGAWWYNSCHDSNLNGVWGSTEFGKGLNWRATTGYYNSATNVVMLMRPLY